MFVYENGVWRSSRLSPARHGFSTRLGGASVLAHTRSMNLGFARGDDDETVLENHRLFAELIGVDARSFVTVPQSHTTNVVTVNEPRTAGAIPEEGADGIVTSARGVTLLVRIADCAPVLLADPTAGVIGAVHSGWRGTLGGIGGVAVEKMVSLGARRERIRAAIGVCIGKCCYVVGEDFVQAFAHSPLARAVSRDESGVCRADLKEMNRAVLLSAGIRDENIDLAPGCTCCEPEKYFSHRYTRGVRGTMGAAICLPE